MKRAHPSRREVLEQCIVRGLLIAGTPLCASCLLGFETPANTQPRHATPENELGPFYKKGAPSTPLLRGAGDPGVALKVAGKVWNTRGDLLRDARIDVWQADHQGHYDVTGYRYRARLTPSPSGDYSFESVMPGHYPDRVAQHIHYLISASGHKALVTQLYFATDPAFEGDPDKNYGKDPLVESRELIRPITLFEQPGQAAHVAVSFDLCLERL